MKVVAVQRVFVVGATRPSSELSDFLVSANRD